MFGQLWVLTFLALVLAGMLSRSPALAAMGTVGALVAAGTWLWSRASLDRLVYERRLSRHRAFPGEVVELSISLTNGKVFPLTWVTVRDDIPQGLSLLDGEVREGARPRVGDLIHNTSLAGYERVRWRYQLQCNARGLYRLGPATLRSGDPFGFFPRDRWDAAQEALLVYPQPVPLPDLHLPAKWPVGDRRGVRQLHGDASRPAGVREYEPGDPWHRVDWKATARRGALHVKVLEPGASLLTAIVTNIDTIGNPSGGYIPHHLERLATVSASLAQEALSGGQSVALFTNGKSVLFERPMSVVLGRSQQHLILILEALAMLTPFVAAPIEEMLLETRRRVPPGVTTVLVTAVMTPGLIHAIEILQRQRRAPVVLWVADNEPRGIPAGIEWRNLVPYLETLEQGRVQAT